MMDSPLMLIISGGLFLFYFISNCSSLTNISVKLSASGSFTGTYEVSVNTDTKLSLRKKSFLNARLKAKVQGFKKEGHWQYNMDLSPMTQIPLITAE